MNYRINWIRVYTWSTSNAYTLTVNAGVGSGPYVAGTIASITAQMPPTGQVFDKWVINSGNAAIDNINASSAMVTMPASNVTVTATYRNGTSAVPRRAFCPAIPGTSSENPTVMYDINGKKITTVNKGASRLPAGVYISTQKGRIMNMLVIQR